MAPRFPIPASLLALCLVATAATPAPTQQRLRERLAQRMEPQRAAAGRADRATTPAGARVERDIAYGPHPRQRYDIYLPCPPGRVDMKYRWRPSGASIGQPSAASVLMPGAGIGLLQGP